MQPDTDLDLVGSAESCQILGGIHVATLTRWVSAGDIKPAHKLPGKNGAFLFKRTDVVALRDRRAADRAEQSA